MSGIELPVTGYAEQFSKETGATVSQALMYLVFHGSEGMIDKDGYAQAVDAYRTDFKH